jgi:hypothetical protein
MGALGDLLLGFGSIHGMGEILGSMKEQNIRLYVRCVTHVLIVPATWGGGSRRIL